MNWLKFEARENDKFPWFGFVSFKNDQRCQTLKLYQITYLPLRNDFHTFYYILKCKRILKYEFKK